MLAAPIFTELSGVLERAVISAEPIYVVGDLNIRLDRPDDVASRQLPTCSRRLACLAASWYRPTTAVGCLTSSPAAMTSQHRYST